MNRRSVLAGSLLVVMASLSSGPPATAAPLVHYTDWSAVSAGDRHTCAIRIGRLYCWGIDGEGQVGDGPTGSVTDLYVPQQITTATDWKSVSAGGEHTCAIRSIGKLYCWGDDEHGQVGNGSGSADRFTPQQITTATDWKTVSAGGSHTCATRGKLYCWGSDAEGQVGNGSGSADRFTPQQITTATDWKTVSAGGSHTCATRGKLYCWGWNLYGQVGNGTSGEPDRVTPQQITTASDWVSAEAGSSHTCAIRGKLYCWGANTAGQVGDGTSGSGTNRDTPKQITIATDWKTVSAGGGHTCATRGKLYCWGYNFWGQVGNGSDGNDAERHTPQQITGATDWKIVSANGLHTCAVRGKLYCWGLNDYGQLGQGDSGNFRSVPTQT